MLSDPQLQSGIDVPHFPTAKAIEAAHHDVIQFVAA
jgi:hypothetical protein